MLKNPSVLTRRLRRAAVCGLTVLLALPAAAAAQPPVIGDPGRATTGAADGTSPDQRYIVTFRSATSSERTAAVRAGARAVAAAGGRVARELPSVGAVAAWLPEPALDNLRHSPDVERVEVDARRYPTQSGPPWSDTSQNGEVLPYGLAMVQAGQLSDAAVGNRTVCIIDTGYDRGHDDLQDANVTASPDAGTGDPFHDGYGHGSHVAGTIAAIGGNGIGVRGVNPSQRLHLHIVKVFDDNANWTYSSDLVHALSQCQAAGANVVSMSLGGPSYVMAEETAFANADAAGILSIASAGNNGASGTSYQFPASYSSVVSVAAVDANEDVASFSQHNDQVDLAAPGVAVRSTLPAPAGYDPWNGTSMAAPHVSGVAALVWSYNPSWTNAQIRDALQQTAKDKGSPGKDDFYGFGIVQAKAALDYLCGAGCVPPAPPPAPVSDCRVDTSQDDFGFGEAANLNLDASPGDVRLVSSGDLRYDQQNGFLLSGTGFLVTATSWRAQTFRAGVTGDLLSVEVYVFYSGGPGSSPDLKLSVRATSGGMPAGPDLAAATFTTYLGSGWYVAQFPSPPSLTAGAEYALVLRPTADPSGGGYYWLLSDGNTYPDGAHFVSADSGSSWAVPTGNDPYDGWDLTFRTYMRPAPPYVHPASGTLTSSLKDSVAPAGGTVRWGTLSWTAAVPAQTSIQFQVAASNSGAGPFVFVGPDGTAGTWFTVNGASLAQFDGKRYLRYRAVLATDDPAETPVLHDVTLCYTSLPAAGGGGTILRGTVVDAVTGAPIGSAAVNAGAYSAATDASGLFEIAGIAPGTYSVTASAAGYISRTFPSVGVAAGAVNPPLLIALGPPAACVTDTTQARFQAGVGSNVDLTSAPGDVQLARGGGTLDQSQAAAGRGWSFSAGTWQAQTFTPGASGLLTRLDLYLGCSGCGGTDPEVIVEIRDTVGGKPGPNVLAAATIAGFSSLSDQYYTATFTEPASLTAGTQYAFVLRPRMNRALGYYMALSSYDYVLDAGATDQYSGGALYKSPNGGAFWSLVTSDLIFRTYMAAPPAYAAAGTLESAVKNAGSRLARWTSLSWTAASPASTAVKFQVAFSNSAAGPFNFIGPDGTANTFFSTSSAALAPPGLGRYLKYKAFLSTGSASVTPVLHEVTACYEPTAVSQGSFFTLTPCRLLDTRLAGQGPALASGAARLLPVPGACGVPPTARAVAINVTVTQGTGGGYLTVYPGGGAVPGTSTLNFRAGQTRANNAVMLLGDDGALVLLAAVGGGSVHVIVDVAGYFE